MSATIAAACFFAGLCSSFDGHVPSGQPKQDIVCARDIAIYKGMAWKVARAILGKPSGYQYEWALIAGKEGWTTTYTEHFFGHLGIERAVYEKKIVRHGGKEVAEYFVQRIERTPKLYMPYVPDND